MPSPGVRRGQALVELALVLPLLLTLVMGIVDVGYLFNHQLTLTNASREGARLGSLGQTSTQVQNAVIASLQQSGYIPLPDAASVGVDLSSGAATVTLTSTVPMLFASAGPPITLKASTRMRIE